MTEIIHLKRLALVVLIALLVGGIVVAEPFKGIRTDSFLQLWREEYRPMRAASKDDPFFHLLSEAAIGRTSFKVRYDPKYVRIPYPLGDVPADTGVCTDEIIRSYRTLGIDLQELVYEDMKQRGSSYPKLWGLSAPDTNIDHRRVPNLMHFFSRHGEVLPISDQPLDYGPGELVAWRLSSGLLHIGIVVSELSSDGSRPLVVHNIGAGPKMEDALFVGTIVGRFRYKRPTQ